MTATLTSIIAAIKTQVETTSAVVAIDGVHDKDSKGNPFVNITITASSNIQIEISNTFDLPCTLLMQVSAKDVDKCRTVLEELLVEFLPGPSAALNALGVINMTPGRVVWPLAQDDANTEYRGTIEYPILIRFTYT